MKRLRGHAYFRVAYVRSTSERAVRGGREGRRASLTDARGVTPRLTLGQAPRSPRSRLVVVASASAGRM
jgi:hypothetical protein